LFVVVGCWLLVFLHFFHYTPSTRHRKKKGDTMATAPTVARVIIFSSVVVIFVLIADLCGYHSHHTGRCYAIA
jgi:fatty acid desaturase